MIHPSYLQVFIEAYREYFGEGTGRTAHTCAAEKYTMFKKTNGKEYIWESEIMTVKLPSSPAGPS
jgi:hypothetical protein